MHIWSDELFGGGVSVIRRKALGLAVAVTAVAVGSASCNCSSCHRHPPNAKFDLMNLGEVARNYYTTSAPVASMRRFPESGWGANTGSSCARRASGLPGDTSEEQHPVLSAARPGPFVFEFVSTGTGSDAQFTVRAHGDLDCDGIRSTWEHVGRATAAGSAEFGICCWTKQESE